MDDTERLQIDARERIQGTLTRTLQLTIGLGVALLVTLALVYRSWIATNRTDLAVHQALHVGKLLATQERAVRDFLLTRQERALVPYRRAEGEIQIGLRRLAELAEGDAAQRAWGQAIAEGYRRWSAEAAGWIGGLDRGSARPDEELGPDAVRAMNELDRALDAFIAAEQALRDERAARARATVFVASAALLLLALGYGVLMAISHRRQIQNLAGAYGGALAERKRLLQELALGQARWEAALRHLPVGVIVAEAPSGRFLLWNGTAERIMTPLYLPATSLASYARYVGYRANGQPYQTEEWPLVRALLHGETVVREQATIELADGPHVFELSATPVSDGAGRVVMAVLTMLDITDSRLMLEELGRSERRFRSIFEQAAVGIAHVAPDGRWILVNQRYCEITGYTLAELRQRTFQDITHPDDLAEDLAYTRRLLDGEIATFSVAKRYIRKDGGAVWVNLTASLVRKESGEPDYCIAVVEDITQRKQAEAELQALTQELERRVIDRTAQLVAANRELEAFSYSVSHDLRAPLRSVDGFSQVLLEEHAHQLDAEARDYLVRIRSAGQRMAQLIDDLLHLGRLTRTELRRERVDLSALTALVVDELRARVPQHAVAVKIEPGLRAHADPRLVRILLENLLDNAWKFTRGAAHPEVSVGTVAAGGEEVFFVRDNGAGFEMTYADKLFKPFQRLHKTSEFEGTGIGLATVQRIVARHGGRVWAEGEPGRGASIYFTLGR